METANPVKIENWTDIRELVLMSIGTNKGRWWADPGFGSDLWKLRQEGKVTYKTAGTLQQMVLECLAWLKDDGLAGLITCAAEQSGKNAISYTVTVVRPDGQSVMIKDAWYAI
ncbi:MAG: phage GP46 family protein [Spirochaetales bacterium]|jgi:phage gp46-like protein|nr:phage GP46 family protein [Spirochaetales bacterium]